MTRFTLSLLFITATAVSAQDLKQWPQFLGQNGSARASGASTLSFDRKKDLLYRVEIPSGESSPCIWDDQIFMTGKDGDKLIMFAVDRATGKEQWRHSYDAPKSPKFGHKDAGVTMPTACTNGERVFFYLPAYGLVAYKLDGEKVWEHKLPVSKADFGVGSSPILSGDKLILLRDGRTDSKLYAFDEKTGEEIWSVPRLRYRDSHATPFVWDNSERRELIIGSTGSVNSFDLETGKALWQVDGLTPLVCTTPAASKERLYFAAWSTPAAAGPDRLLDGMENPITLTEEERNDPKLLFERLDPNGDGKITIEEAPKGRIRAAYSFFDRNEDGGITLAEWTPLVRMPTMGKNLLIAIKPGGKGNVTETHVEWKVRRGIPYVSSPLLYKDRVYMVKAGGIISCVDAKTGKPRFRKTRLDDHSEYYATPVGVDDHVILCSSAGTLYVIKVADELKIVRTVEFDEPIFATPAIVDGTIYLRTKVALYAFGSKN